jgi:colanic acid/amylovoran biosynthesis glycosyltransferase
VVWHWLLQHARVDQPLLLYTYWRGGPTMAAARWSSAHPDCATVTRVHRYELYDEAFRPPFQPWTAVYGQLSRVLPIAAHGRDYLVDRGVPPARITLARLGVPAAVRRSAASTDGVLRVVTCSTLTAVKRVPFTAQALCAFARRVPGQQIEWHHFGDGPERAAVGAALAEAPANLVTTLHGRVAHPVVLDHYRQHPVDLFVLLSAGEGLPVAIQEALAAGIPVLACDVGGVAEAVLSGGDNGRLLAPDVDVAGVVAAMHDLLIGASGAERAARREAAFRTWAALFDAPRNHAALARNLRDTID